MNHQGLSLDFSRKPSQIAVLPAGQSIQFTVSAQISEIPFEDAKMKVYFSKLNGIRTEKMIILPLVPQNFITYYGEDAAKQDQTRYEASLRSTFPTKLDRFGTSLQQSMQILFPYSFINREGAYTGIFCPFDNDVLARYEAKPVAGGSLDLYLQGHSLSGQTSHQGLEEILSFLMHSYQFLLN